VGHELRIERLFDAPPEIVFDAFLDRRAQFGGAWGATIESDLDLRVGGRWTVVYRWRGAEPDLETSVFSEIDPPRRLAFTWFWDDDPNSVRQLIELDFEETDGVTLVRFTHSDLWNEEAVRSHEDGWSTCFDNLERVLAEQRA
jgi:uncharacterized protein YndB with AHSA1/START domain